MKALALITLVLLSFSTGCANQNGRTGETPGAPAGFQNGWSVPPGGTAAPVPTDRGEATQKPEVAFPASETAELKPEEAPTHTETVVSADRSAGAPVKPLVPAFPIRLSRERVVNLSRVYFGFDSWAISTTMAPVLEANARWLKAHPEVRVRVEGHTDAQGTPEYNLSLGVRRATAVRDFLIHQGVSLDSLELVSYGEELPLAAGTGEKAYRQNRRAEFSLIDSPKVSQHTVPQNKKAVRPGM